MVAHLDAVTSLSIDPSGLYILSGSKLFVLFKQGVVLTNTPLTCMWENIPFYLYVEKIFESCIMYNNLLLC